MTTTNPIRQPSGLDPKGPQYYVRQVTRLGRSAARAVWFQAWAPKDFSAVQTFGIFIGYPRSGHSVVGSLLDAHPEMTFSHELDALQLVSARFRRQQLFQLILDNSRQFSAAGRSSPFYSYSVPTQWQGRYRTLRVLGDKQGEATTHRLHTDPGLLARLRATVAVPVKVIHVIRNPFDNIATISRRLQIPPDAAAAYYFRLTAMVEQTRQNVPTADWLDMRHEDLVADPQASLAGLCRFLGVEPFPDYLTDCAAVIFPASHRTRGAAGWDRSTITAVEGKLARYAWLQQYRFED